MKEIAEVLKSSAEQAGMRSPSDDIDTVAYGKIVDTLDDEALLLWKSYSTSTKAP